MSSADSVSLFENFSAQGTVRHTMLVMRTAVPYLYKMECDRLSGLTNQLTGSVGQETLQGVLLGEYEGWIRKLVLSKYLNHREKEERSPETRD